jgi:hypothetical protein
MLRGQRPEHPKAHYGIISRAELIWIRPASPAASAPAAGRPERIALNISSTDFRIGEGEKPNLGKRPTVVAAAYASNKQSSKKQ